MAYRMVTDAMQAKAERLAEEASGWLRGRSKANGAGFYVVPASDGTTAHWVNSFGCTCEGFRRRGECAHRLACELMEQREMAARIKAAQKPRKSAQQLYEELMNHHLVEA